MARPTLSMDAKGLAQLLKDLGYPYIPTHWCGELPATTSDLLEINVHGYRITISQSNLKTMVIHAWNFPTNIVTEYVIKWPQGKVQPSMIYRTTEYQVRYNNVITYLRDNFKQSINHHLKQ